MGRSTRAASAPIAPIAAPSHFCRLCWGIGCSSASVPARFKSVPPPGGAPQPRRPPHRHTPATMSGLSQQELVKRIMAINQDPSLSDAEKAAARQDLMSGKWKEKVAAAEDTDATKSKSERRRPPPRFPPQHCALLPRWPASLAFGPPPSPHRSRGQGQERGQQERGGGEPAG